MHSAPAIGARASDPRASHEADDYMTASGKRAFQQRTAVAAVERHPGLTALEIATRAKVCRYMLGRRLPELEREQLVRRGAERRCTVSGRLACTWWPKDTALQASLFDRSLHA